MRIILIRHGQTSSNIGRHLDTGEPGAPLTNLGHEQANLLPRTLENERIDAIYASPLLRTQQTAKPLASARGISVQTRSGICEVSAGDLEMANDENSIQTYLKIVMDWADGSEEAMILGAGENGSDVLRKFDRVVDEVRASAVDSAVFVSHGAIIRSWVGSRCVNIEPGFVAQTPVLNTGVVVVEETDGQWRVVQWQEQPIGGPEVQSPESDGPAAETPDGN